jgi:DNA repair protein RecO (recombination protein O)
MEWTDDGIVLSARPHGESAAIVMLLTHGHGRHAGLVHGGAGRSKRGVLQPGNRVKAVWRARMADQLGTFTCEAAGAPGAALLDDARRLAALSAACAVTEAAMSEREPHPGAYDGLGALLEALAGEVWAEAYIRWEVEMLRELGFGLDLSRCAATGTRDGLAYVSPRTGRAVSLSAGAPYRDRLLALPAFLLGRMGPDREAEMAAGLALTGHFLERHVFHPQNREIPAARQRLAERFPLAKPPADNTDS